MGSLRFPTANFDETTAQFFGVLVIKDFTDLVYMKKSAAMADSLGVAKRFNKQHKNVMQAIDNVIKTDAYQSRLANGHPMNFVLKRKKQFMPHGAIRNDPYYEMDLAGLFILISEFTVSLAKSFRIKCFNEGFDAAW